MKKDYISILLKSSKTIFTPKDIALLWREDNIEFVKKKIHRYIKSGRLQSIRRGIYAKDKEYDKYELATKIYTPSYISLETVLREAGMIFQFYGQIFAVTYRTRETSCDGQKYVYKQIKDGILYNNAGIERRDNYYIATPERAFLDTLYLHKNYYFDNLSTLNWDKVYQILPIYKNKRIEKLVKFLHNRFKQDLK